MVRHLVRQLKLETCFIIRQRVANSWKQSVPNLLKIQDIVGKLALSNPHISFKLIVDDRVAIITPGNGNIGDTVAALYGYKTKDDIFTVAYESDSIYIDGVVSKPTLLKVLEFGKLLIV